MDVIDRKVGSVSQEVLMWIEKYSKDYPYMIEVSAKTSSQKFSVWANAHLPKRKYPRSFREHYSRPVCGAQYCIMPLSRFVDTSNYLVGFVTFEDQRQAVDHFGDSVVWTHVHVSPLNA